MAKVKPSIIEESGAIGDRVYYTRFGKTFSRRRPAQINDRQSEAQLRQRVLFKVMQHTASLLGSVIQRGLAKEAHKNGHVENNFYAGVFGDNINVMLAAAEFNFRREMRILFALLRSLFPHPLCNLLYELTLRSRICQTALVVPIRGF